MQSQLSFNFCLDQWTEFEIESLRHFVLTRTVAILDDGRASLRSRTEALEWMLCDETDPFSFRMCCIHGANVDPDEFRELVISQLSKRK